MDTTNSATVRSSIEDERLRRGVAERSVAREHELAADLELEMMAVREQFKALRREAAGGMPLSLALPRLDHSLEAPLALSPPVATMRQRHVAGRTLDRSLVEPPSGQPSHQKELRRSLALDHSLVAPATWLRNASTYDGDAPREGDGETGSSVSTPLANVPWDHMHTQANEGTLDLLVVVVDETFALPRLRSTLGFHGRVHDLRGLSPTLTGAQLVAQCVEGVPVVSRPGGRWCLCWGEAVVADEHGDHELGTPGSRIEVIEEPAPGILGGSARRMDNWTLADAGIETDDVLWCRYLALHS